MTTMKLDVEKFTRNNDFGLWKIKMEALLIQHGLANALKLADQQASSSTMDEAKKNEILEKAHSAII
ncbi:hypothetical protein ACS0TY_027574 [Phlomoides rotata]